VGSINLDLVVRADRISRVGETITGNSFHSYYGGKGANQPVAAANLEVEAFLQEHAAHSVTTEASW
jgi:ribokinase